MGIVIAIVIGGIAGWLASMVMNRDGSMGIFANIIVGVVGGLIGNFVGHLLLGVGDPITEFSIGNLVTAFVGAVILLAIINMFQRGRVR